MKRNRGFIREKLDIKILILFIMRHLTEPIPLEALTVLVMDDDAISYFDFMECVIDLVRTQHLEYSDEKYSLTDKGARNGEITENSLPFNVRVQMENAAFEYSGSQNRNAMIHASHKANSDGSCMVSLSMSDGLGEVFSAQLHATSEKQALSLEKGFRKNAEKAYNMLLEAIIN